MGSVKVVHYKGRVQLLMIIFQWLTPTHPKKTMVTFFWFVRSSGLRKKLKLQTPSWGASQCTSYVTGAKKRRIFNFEQKTKVLSLKFLTKDSLGFGVGFSTKQFQKTLFGLFIFDSKIWFLRFLVSFVGRESSTMARKVCFPRWFCHAWKVCCL